MAMHMQNKGHGNQPVENLEFSITIHVVFPTLRHNQQPVCIRRVLSTDRGVQWMPMGGEWLADQSNFSGVTRAGLPRATRKWIDNGTYLPVVGYPK